LSIAEDDMHNEALHNRAKTIVMPPQQVRTTFFHALLQSAIPE